MSLRVDDFKAKLKGGGARPNLFRATVNFPVYAGGDVELTSFMCKSAQLPASIMAVIEVPFRGRQLKIAGDRTFEPWTVTVLNDTDFSIRNAIERWSNGINNHSDNEGLVNPVDYQVDAFVDHLDRNGNTIKSYTFRGMFPKALDAIELTYAPATELEQFTCTWRYQYWESNTTT